MTEYPLDNGPDTEHDEDFWEPKGELKERIEELIRNGELELGPSLLERYVHPLTGEVLIEGGPDTPETRAAREETAKWWAETVGKPWPPKEDGPTSSPEQSTTE